jgi:hypothetical protein
MTDATKLCEAIHEEEDATPLARWSLPQSIDLGITITYVDVCDFHRQAWWEDADWDGSKLERPIRRLTCDL